MFDNLTILDAELNSEYETLLGHEIGNLFSSFYVTNARRSKETKSFKEKLFILFNPALFYRDNSLSIWTERVKFTKDNIKFSFKNPIDVVQTIILFYVLYIFLLGTFIIVVYEIFQYLRLNRLKCLNNINSTYKNIIAQAKFSLTEITCWLFGFKIS